MAIVKNTTFKGLSVYDVDPGAATEARTIRNVQGDVAGALAHLVDDTDPLHIDHSGGSRGALLGIPWVSQAVGYDTKIDAGGAKNGGTSGPQYYPYLVRCDASTGETGFIVDVTIQSQNYTYSNPRVRVSMSGDFAVPATSGALERPLLFVRPDEGGAQIGTGQTAENFLLRARIDDVAGTAIVLVTLIFDGFADNDAPVSILDVTIRSLREPRATMSPTNDPANPVPVVAPASTAALFHQSMDDSIFADGEGATGWHTSRLDRNINGLLEYATGAPAGKNATYTHTESALRNPTRDRFGAFTRKTFADEPIPVIPVASVNFGGVTAIGYLANPAVPASLAARKSFAPFPASSGGNVIAECGMCMPDVPSSPSVLSWAVLMGRGASTSALWSDVRMNLACGSSASTLGALMTPIANSPNGWAIADGTALAFARDSTNNRLRIFPSQPTGSWNTDAYCVLAAAAWIEE